MGDTQKGQSMSMYSTRPCTHSNGANRNMPRLAPSALVPVVSPTFPATTFVSAYSKRREVTTRSFNAMKALHCVCCKHVPALVCVVPHPRLLGRFHWEQKFHYRCCEEGLSEDRPWTKTTTNRATANTACAKAVLNKRSMYCKNKGRMNSKQFGKTKGRERTELTEADAVEDGCDLIQFNARSLLKFYTL